MVTKNVLSNIGDPQGGVVKTISLLWKHESNSSESRPSTPDQTATHTHTVICHWKIYKISSLQLTATYFVSLELQSGQQHPMEELHSYAEGQPIFKVGFVTKIKSGSVYEDV